MRLISTFMFIIAALVLPASAQDAGARGAEVCVECTGPDKVYVCQVERGQKVAGFRAGLQALQYLCITELARVGRHAVCKARQNTANCLGTIHTMSVEEAARAMAQPPPPGDQKAAVDASAGKPPVATGRPEKPKGPPQTVQELAERTAETSGQQAKSAGDAVASGFKKSWTCFATLFQKC